MPTDQLTRTIFPADIDTERYTESTDMEHISIIAYGCRASVIHAAEDTLSQARASSNLNQLNAVSAFKSGQLELLTGPTFYLNQTTKRLVIAR